MMDMSNAADTNNLPTLEGSEKQIAWATSIRAAAISAFDGIEQEYAIAYANGKDWTTHVETVRQMVTTNTSAAWFIDNAQKAGIDGNRWVVSVAQKVALAADLRAAGRSTAIASLRKLGLG